MLRKLKDDLALWLCGVLGTGALALVLGLIAYLEELL